MVLFKEENLKAPLIPRSNILRISEALKFLNFAVCPPNVRKVSELVLSQTSSHGFINSQIFGFWTSQLSGIPQSALSGLCLFAAANSSSPVLEHRAAKPKGRDLPFTYGSSLNHCPQLLKEMKPMWENQLLHLHAPEVSTHLWTKLG